MRGLMGMITALSIPLMILNMLGDIVSGIWLAVLGDWGAIGIGIASLLASTIVLGPVLMPSIFLTATAFLCAKKGRTISFICFSALDSLYTLAVVTIWCCGVLFFFVKDATSSSLVPRLIWSYGVATGPWAYMASKDQGGGGEGFASFLATFLAELAYVTIMILVLFTPVTLAGAIKVFAGLMVVGLVVQITLAVMTQEGKRLAEQAAVLDE
jgi:hypothetical protein